MLSERLNYSALHGLRHVGSMGSGLFGTPHFLSGYNRSIMSPSPIQPISNPNMILYNAANNIRPFQIPTSSSSRPLHPLSTDFGVLAAAAAQAGSSATNNAAAIAMQAAATQAASYQNTLKSAAHLVHEMKTAQLETIEANTNSPNIVLATLSQQHGNLDRHSLFPGLSSALTSSNVSSRNSPPLSLCTSRIKFVSESNDIK